MRRIWQAVYSWKLIVSTTLVSMTLLLLSIALSELKLVALILGWIAAFAHFGFSIWLWRDYMYGNADFDSEDSYAPSGISKSYFMLGSFALLLLTCLAVTIISIEGSLYLPSSQ